MSKKFLTAIIFSILVILAVGYGSVSAVSVNPEVISGGWMGDGKTVPVNVTGTTYPEWLTLVSTMGFKVTESQQICHAFPGGQDGWVADVRVKSGSEWLSVPTTQGWEPDEEGTYMACADVNWGTHALFAYYVKPEKTAESLPECEFSPQMTFVNHPDGGWQGDPYTGWYFEAIVFTPDFAEGSAVSYKITDSTNLPTEIKMSASGTSEIPTGSGPTQTVLFYPVSSPPASPWNATFLLTYPTCYKEVVYYGGAN